jgi:hypothetical protein
MKYESSRYVSCFVSLTGCMMLSSVLSKGRKAKGGCTPYEALGPHAGY